MVIFNQWLNVTTSLYLIPTRRGFHILWRGALIGLMVYIFARVGAVTKMRVEDVLFQGRRT